MRKFEIVVCRCKTLEVISRHIIEAENIELARMTGIARWQQPNYFVGAQSPIKIGTR